VWWISANIRNEREHACDDLAIDIIGNKLRYAKSLLLLQEWEGKRTPGLAMSFSSKTTPLFERMKRILNQPKNKHEMKQKIIASLILITSIVWISATEPVSKVKSKTQSQDFTSTTIEKQEGQKPLIYQIGSMDTIPKKIKESKSTIIELKDGKIKRLNIDGVDVPESELEEHTDYINELKSENYFRFDTNNVFVFPEMEGFAFDMESQEDLRQGLDRMKFHLDSLRPRLNEEFRELHNFNDEWRFELEEGLGQLDSVFADMDFKENEFQFYRGNFDTIRFNFDSLRSKMKDLDFYFEDMAGQFRIMMDSIDFPELSENLFEHFDSMDFGDFGQDFNFNFDSLQFPKFDHHYDLVYGNNLERAFIRELKEDGLYQKEGNEFRLTDDTLEINGELQSAEMHKKYKTIYEDKTGIELLKGSNLKIKIDNSSENKNMRRL
jgi:hypothetical protein